MSLQLSEKDLENQDVLAEKLITLAEIVVRKHFYASLQDKEDLVSIGVLKALTMISSGNWDKSKGNFMTYIYTGMRNDMHNYLYHENKFDTTDLDVLSDRGKEDEYFESDEVFMSYSLIHSVCLNFIPSFGDNIERLVLLELEEMGYVIKGRVEPVSAYSYCCDLVVDEYGEDAQKDIVSRIIGIILWKKKEYGI